MKRNRTAPIHFSPRDAHGTTSGTPTGTRAAGDVGPYHVPRHVRTRTPRAAHARHARTWSGATSSARRCPRNDIGDAHGDAGRRGRRPLPRTAPCPPTHAISTHARHVRTRTPRPHTHAMRAPGPARRPRRAVAHGTSTGRHRERPRARGPLGTSAPTTLRATSAHAHRAPHTHSMRAPGRARRPRRAAPTEHPRNDIGDAHGDAGRRDVGPYHAPRHIRTRTARAAHRGRRGYGACLPCQRIETLMGFRNAVAKSRTRACHAFASFTTPAPLQVAPAQ